MYNWECGIKPNRSQKTTSLEHEPFSVVHQQQRAVQRRLEVERVPVDVLNEVVHQQDVNGVHQLAAVGERKVQLIFAQDVVNIEEV